MPRTSILLVTLLLLAGCASSSRTPLPETKNESTAPTPYTAEQIRDFNPPGTTLVYRIDQSSTSRVLHMMAFVEGVDADEYALIETRTLMETGKPVGDTKRAETSWVELRDHAAFPREATVRTAATCTVPAGQFACDLYEVKDRQNGVATTSRYYFARNRPGPPVLMETEVAGKITFRMALLTDSRP